MSPLTLGSRSEPAPTDFPGLIRLLTSRAQPALIHYSASGDRVELSGRVLANWAVKLVGLLREETETFQEEHHAEPPVVLVHTAVQWKAAAAALAAAALGAQVHLVAPGGRTALPQDPALVITDEPRAWLAQGTENTEAALDLNLGDAELAALAPGALDNEFDDGQGPLPAWVLDIAAEVRQHPDQLFEPLEPVVLPAYDESAPGPSGTTDPQEQALLVRTWEAASMEQLTHYWSGSRQVVMVEGQPSPQLWAQITSNERLD